MTQNDKNLSIVEIPTGMLQLDQLLGIVERRGKSIPGQAYKLSGNQYGMDVAIADSLDIDESEMSLWLPFASGERRDGVGDLTEVGGIRTERHIGNPIALFDHGKNTSLPIGLCEDPNSREYTVLIDPINQTAKAKIFFWQGNKGLDSIDGEQKKDHALLCEQLFSMMVKRLVRAGSFGYQVLKAEQMPPDYARGTPQGLHLLSTLLLEVSPVVLPANADTVRKTLCDGVMCGKPLSPVLIKSLTPYSGEKKV